MNDFNASDWIADKMTGSGYRHITNGDWLATDLYIKLANAEGYIFVESLISNWQKLRNKCEDIRDLPEVVKYGEVGKHFRSLEIDEDGIELTTDTKGRDEDYYHTMYIKWDDINKPLSYFSDMYKEKNDAIIREKALKDKILKEKAEEDQNLKDMREFERLKAKFGK